jgi:hypothetical protein
MMFRVNCFTKYITIGHNAAWRVQSSLGERLRPLWCHLRHHRDGMQQCRTGYQALGDQRPASSPVKWASMYFSYFPSDSSHSVIVLSLASSMCGTRLVYLPDE